MSWIILSAILGGIVVGFMAGASPSPTGGNVAAAVSALLLGVLGFKDSSDKSNYEFVGMLFVIFLIGLIISYIAGNVLRKKGHLEWMGIKKPK